MQACVLRWLEATAERMPGKTAIVDEYEQLSFKQYHDKSIGIARMILDALGKSRQPVVVYLEKSAKVLVSFMGIAYSGNFYSPIDVEMPKQRVDKILEVLKPELVITSRELISQFEQFNYTGKYVIYEEVPEQERDLLVEQAVNRIVDTDLLYVLFTSGSTGVPKGVCITHRGVVDYIDWVTDTFQITQEDSFGNQAPFYFDNSILDIYSTMKTGAMLYIVPRKLFSQPVRLLEFLQI